MRRKDGMSPGVARHSDPTFEAVLAKFQKEEREAKRKHESMAAFRIFATIRELVRRAGYRIIGAVCLQNEKGHRFVWEASGEKKHDIR